VLARAVTDANERLDAKGLALLPEGLTPHSLRRTFASVLYALGRSPVDVMDQLGHTDPKLALRIYARAMRRDPGEVDRLRSLAGVTGGPDWAEAGTSPEIEAQDADRAASPEAVRTHS
jgi:integrase